MATSQHLPVRDRVRLALRHWPPTERMVDLVLARLPDDACSLDPRAFGKAAREALAAAAGAGEEY